MSVEQAYRALVAAGVKKVLAMPDSFLAPLCRRVKTGPEIGYIQTTHEATGIGMAAGLTLTGTRSLMLMENSGLRSACETLARLNLSHGLYTCSLISHRGAFGERHWWGLAHHETMVPMLDALRFRYHYVRSVDEFGPALVKAYQTLAASQCSVALIAEPGLLEGLRQ